MKCICNEWKENIDKLNADLYYSMFMAEQGMTESRFHIVLGVVLNL